MKPTPFASIASWMSKIHQPLPRTPRQSQQLLAVLNQSFQRQLDKAHPPIVGVQDSDRHIVEKEDPNDSRSTNHHFDTLFQHAAFNPSRAYHRAIDPSCSDPRAVLEDAFQHSQLTPDLISRCLKADESLPKPGRLSDGTTRTIDKSLGLRIAEMVGKCDNPTRGRIFTDPLLMKNLTGRLVDEGQSGVVWEWLQDLFSGNLILDADDGLLEERAMLFTRVGKTILNTMITYHATRGQLHLAIDECLVPLIRAKSLRGKRSVDKFTRGVQLGILRNGIRKVFKFIVYQGGFGGSPPRLFDEMLHHSSLIDPVPSATAGHHWRALSLYHPSPSGASLSTESQFSAARTRERQHWLSYFADAYGPDFAMSLVERAKTIFVKDDDKEGLVELVDCLIALAKTSLASNQPLPTSPQQGQAYDNKASSTDQFAMG